MKNKNCRSIFSAVIILAFSAGLTTGAAKAQSAAPAAGQSGDSKGAKPLQIPTYPGLHFSNDIPVNFPIPPYTSNVFRKSFINSTKGAPRATLSIGTKDKPDVVYQWYKNTCRASGWAFRTPNPQSTNQFSKMGTIYMIDANKDRNQVRIMCLPDKSGGTSIGITWLKIQS